MKIEIETGSYNDRRYSKPWIAKVDFESNANGTFHFGEWVGQPGEEGILLLDVEVGDVVAQGQKDFRKPRNSAPEWYKVTEGGLVSCTKPEAYKHWKAQHVAA